MQIELSDIHKTYRPSGEAPVRAVRGVDLRIRPGERVALMGPSGCGKTTLLSILGLLARPTGGLYRLGETDVSALSRTEQARCRARSIGFVFQSYNLLPRERAWRNVVLPLTFRPDTRRVRREKAMQALDAVGLAHRARHVPAQMSGGEQQRVAIARALIVEPSLLIADEPTGNLDSASGRQVMELLSGIANSNGITIVMATHDPATAAYADRIVHMRDGVLVTDSPPASPAASRPPGRASEAGGPSRQDTYPNGPHAG